MGRKKKIVEEVVLKPSHYQEAIYDFVEHDVGNLVVEAAAGAGKTSTLLQILRLLPSDKKVLFCAFNKDIVKEITKKVPKDITNVDIRTVHSLGFLMIQRNLKGEEIIPNENKYRQFIYNNLDVISMIDTTYMKYKDRMKYIDNICNLVDFARFYLVNSEKEIEKLVDRYDVDIIADEVEATIKVLEWGKTSINEIDFTDMIWLPYVLDLKPIGLLFDYILGDECQDFSIAQRELLLRCRKINTRMFFFGDKNQAIYSFCSADPQSFDVLKSLPNTKSLPLSISYRCAKNIVRFAQNIVETIEHNEANINEGEIKYNVQLEEVEDGDMVLCRNTAPLMEVYRRGVSEGRKMYFRGEELGNNLKLSADCAQGDTIKEIIFSMKKRLIATWDFLTKEFNLDPRETMTDRRIVSLLDTIKTMENLPKTVENRKDLDKFVKDVFSEEGKEGIQLSTIHRAKGLEADNVFIICPSLIPSRLAELDWEKDEEKHLQYVMCTRPKNTLNFVTEQEIRPHSAFSENNSFYNELMEIKKELNG